MVHITVEFPKDSLKEETIFQIFSGIRGSLKYLGKKNAEIKIRAVETIVTQWSEKDDDFLHIHLKLEELFYNSIDTKKMSEQICSFTESLFDVNDKIVKPSAISCEIDVLKNYSELISVKK